MTDEEAAKEIELVDLRWRIRSETQKNIINRLLGHGTYDDVIMDLTHEIVELKVKIERLTNGSS